MGFDLAAVPVRDRHALLTRVVAPRPTALVSSLGSDGGGNLAPFSYFMLGGSNPPSVPFCPVDDRAGPPKDTLRNVAATGEFVVSRVTPAMAERMSQASYPYERGEDGIGEVVYLTAADAVLTGGLRDNHKLTLIARLGGDRYARITGETWFELPRPRGP